MLVQYHHPQSHAMLRKIAYAFRFAGWIGFWLQLAMAFISGLALVFATFGQNFSPDPHAGSSTGVFWATCSMILLGIAIVLAFRYVRTAKSLLHEPGAVLHPTRHETLRLVRSAAWLGFAGMVLALIGAGTSVGVLIAKTVSQPPGMAIVDPTRIVRAIDVFIVLANLNLTTAHLLGTAISFWLLDRVHHYRHQYHHEHFFAET